MLLILCFSNGSVLFNSSARKFNANRNNQYWEEYALAKPKTVKDPSKLCYTRAVTTLGHETRRAHFISFEFTQGHMCPHYILQTSQIDWKVLGKIGQYLETISQSLSIYSTDQVSDKPGLKQSQWSRWTLFFVQTFTYHMNIFKNFCSDFSIKNQHAECTHTRRYH